MGCPNHPFLLLDTPLSSCEALSQTIAGHSGPSAWANSGLSCGQVLWCRLVEWDRTSVEPLVNGMGCPNRPFLLLDTPLSSVKELSKAIIGHFGPSWANSWLFCGQVMSCRLVEWDRTTIEF